MKILKSIQGMKSIMKYFGGSAIKALVYLFPDIGLDSSKFLTFPSNCCLSFFTQ